MSDISVQGVGANAWKRAHSLTWSHPFKAAAVLKSPRQRASLTESAPRGGWLVNRVVCAVRGHRQLVATAATAKILSSGMRRELFLCHACGSYAWKEMVNSYRPSWSEVAV